MLEELFRAEKQNIEKKTETSTVTQPKTTHESLTERTVLIDNMSTDITRVKFLEIMESTRFNRSLDILIFKVDKEGCSIGEAKLMFISKEKAELALKELPV